MVELQVQVYNYTCHLTKSNLADKMGCAIFIRRSLRGYSLLAFLLRTLKINEICSDSLTQLLKIYNVNMRKNATKLCKLRGLMKVDSILKDLTAEEATAVEEVLQEMESKKKKKMKKMAMKRKRMESFGLEHIMLEFCFLPKTIYIVNVKINRSQKDVPEDDDDAAMKAACRMMADEEKDDEDCIPRTL